MRNGIFMILNDYHLPINTLKDYDDDVLIRFEGNNCPFPDFFRSKHEEDVYYLKKSISEIAKAYNVKTFGLYKGYKFGVFDKKTDSRNGDLIKLETVGNVVRIGTRDKEAIKRLSLYGDSDWGFTDISKSELEKIWEERTPVFDLPMPHGINAIVEITI